MRVLQVSHAWDEGGSALYADALATALAPLADVRRFSPADVPGRRARGFGGAVRDPAAEAAFTAALAGVDLVHIHHLSGLGVTLPALAARAGAVVVVHLHDYWLVCARGQLVDESGARCPGPAPDRCARCLHADQYAPLPPALSARLPLRRGRVRERAEAWAQTRAHTRCFLSPSRHVAARMGVPARIVGYPLLAPIAPAPPPRPGPLRVLFLGSFIPTKGPDVLLAAFAGLPAGAATLRLVGPAPPWRGSRAWADALLARARETPGVQVEGMRDRAAVVAALHDADLLVVPSTWEENAPLVLAEARAAGLRVLASDVGGVPEVAPEARLVEPGSVPALRAALADEVRRGAQRNPPQPAPSLRRHAEEMMTLYAELLGP